MNLTHPCRFIAGIFPTLVLALGGCASQSAPSGSAPTLLVSVQVAGGFEPTRQQSERILQAISPAIARAGYRFAPSVETADYMVVVTFTPDPLHPEQGHLQVHKIEASRRISRNHSDTAPTQLSAMQERQSELERWANSRSAPTNP